MLATFWLLGLVLGSSQAPTRPTPAPATARSELVLTPRLGRGQELVYRGTFSQQASGTRVQYQRAYRFETRYLVMDVTARHVELAAMTSLRDRSAGATQGTPTAARLERLRLDLDGKIIPETGVPLTVPLEGAPTLEVGAFVEVSRGRMQVGQGWEVSHPGEPVVSWQVAGRESISGHNCVKLVGVQQSDDWGRPRADRSAWRRQDTVWLAARSGYAVRVERTIEQCEPARREVSRRSVLKYDLESDLVYSAKLGDDRRQEVRQALSFRDTARPMFSEPAKHSRSLAALQKRITSHVDSHPPTPYREAVLAIRRQVEAAARGEAVTVVRHESARVPTAGATIGSVAPDFLVSEITGSGTARLSKWRGKPVLLVFYQPGAENTPQVLHFAQEVHSSLGKYAQIVGLSISDDVTTVLKQRTALKLTFPILQGGGMATSYGIDGTPRLVLIDATGIVRAAYTGWGLETSYEVLAELRRWLPNR